MTEIKGDLISRSELLKAIDCYTTKRQDPLIWQSDVEDLINNAPAVEVKDGYDLGYEKGKSRGYFEGLEDGKAQAEAVEYEYIAVRSYTDGCNTSKTKLDKALGIGYELVRASEVVKNSKDYSDYIEYILRRQKKNG